MIRAISAACLSAALFVFAAGCGDKQPPAEQPKPGQADHPAKPANNPEKPADPATPAQDKPKDHPAH
jgi:hypothetical protein